MEYVLIEWEHDLDEEPYLIYSELDSRRRETRRVEFYRNGVTFSYGGERGNEAVLSAVPFPKNLREIDRNHTEEGELTARSISPGLFYEIWNQAQERPDGFMGMFF